MSVLAHRWSVVIIAGLMCGAPAAMTVADDFTPSGIRLTTKDHEHHLRVIDERTADITISDWVWDRYARGLERLDHAHDTLMTWVDSLPREYIHGKRPADYPPSLGEIQHELMLRSFERQARALLTLEEQYFDSLALHHVPEKTIRMLRHEMYRRHLLSKNELFPGANVDVFALLSTDLELTLAHDTLARLAEIHRAYDLDVSHLLSEQASIALDHRFKPRLFPRWPVPLTREERRRGRARRYVLEAEIAARNDACITHLMGMPGDDLADADVLSAWRHSLYPFLWDSKLDALLGQNAISDARQLKRLESEIHAYQLEMHGKLWATQIRAAQQPELDEANSYNQVAELLAEFNELAEQCRTRIAEYTQSIRELLPKSDIEGNAGSPPSFLHGVPRGGAWSQTIMMSVTAQSDTNHRYDDTFRLSEPVIPAEDFDHWISQTLPNDATTSQAMRAAYATFLNDWTDATRDLRSAVHKQRELRAVWREAGKAGPQPQGSAAFNKALVRWTVDRLDHEEAFLDSVAKLLNKHGALDSWNALVITCRRRQVLDDLNGPTSLPLPDLLILLADIGISPRHPAISSICEEYQRALDDAIRQSQRRYYKLSFDIAEARLDGSTHDHRRAINHNRLSTLFPLYNVTIAYATLLSSELPPAHSQHFQTTWRSLWFPEITCPTPADLAISRLQQWLPLNAAHLVTLFDSIARDYHAQKARVDDEIMRAMAPATQLLARANALSEPLTQGMKTWWDSVRDLPYAVYTNNLVDLQYHRYELIASMCDRLHQMFAGETRPPPDVLYLLTSTSI